MKRAVKRKNGDHWNLRNDFDDKIFTSRQTKNYIQRLPVALTTIEVYLYTHYNVHLRNVLPRPLFVAERT